MPIMFSSGDFHMIVGIAVTNAMHEVLEKCYEELQKEIQMDVYDAYSPESYSRTEGLLDSWKREWSRLSTELRFEPSLLPIAPTRWQHGSLYDDGTGKGYTDVRDVLIDIIAGGYRAYNAHTGRPIGGRPFWDKYVAKVNANLDNWMKSALAHQGLAVI